MPLKTNYTRIFRCTVLGGVFTLLFAGPSWAQSGSRNAVGGGGGGVGGATTTTTTGGGGFGGFGGPASISSDGTITGGFGGGASTPIESNLRGVSSLVRAQSQARNTDAQAAINREAATSQAISNQVAAARARLEIAKARIETAKLETAFLKETRDQRRARLATLRARPKRVGPRLTTFEYDKYTGEVQWPSALSAPLLAQHRAAVERALDPKMQKKKYGNDRLLAAVDSLQQAIGKNAKKLGYKKFATAKNFAQRLQNQIKFESRKRTEMVAKM